jgi:2-polyprenyl-6-hydroxyphenyl methylase/3-demethylubiquinone-9 3-methyltransferase
MTGALDSIPTARLLSAPDPAAVLARADALSAHDGVIVTSGARGSSAASPERARMRALLFDAGFLPLREAPAGEESMGYLRSALLQEARQAGASGPDGVSMTKLGHRGRFANQLFQYAFLRLYGLRNHLTAKTPEWQGEAMFGLDDVRAVFNEYPDIVLDSFEEDDLVLWDQDAPPANVNFDGPFQEVPVSWRAHRHFLRLLFTPKPEWNAALAEARAARADRTLVVLHVRRGDYETLTARDAASPFRTVPLEWHAAALQELWPQLRNPVLHVATDGGDAVKKFFSAWPQLKSLPAAMPADLADFFLLRDADVALICNSSFSRMASLLAEEGQQVFLPDFTAKRFLAYDPWDDRAFWAWFHPDKRPDALVASQRRVSLRLRQALGVALHRPSGSLAVTASPEPLPCRCCGARALLHQVVDFNSRGGSAAPVLSGAPVYYRRCQDCGFVFTDAFDAWQPYDFQRYVYNETFFAADPGFLMERPGRRAREIAAFFPSREKLAILDYGGLNYATVEGLKEAGFARVGRLDLLDSGQPPVDGKFDIVSCCDVLERVPDAREIARELAGHVAENGVILCVTRMQADDVSPALGRVSVFSPMALVALWREQGLKTALLRDGWHLAWRGARPGFAPEG